MRMTFIDGIGATQIVAGTVRLDLVTLAAAAAGSQPVAQPTGEQLVMSVEGFVRLHGQITNVVDQLVSRGILQRNAATKPAESVEAPEPAKVSKNGRNG